jgi:hypothetical protein
LESVLGVISLIVYIAAIVGLSAGVTWLVIKISPSRDKPKSEPEPDATT